MSNTDRETQNVIMAVQKAAFLMDAFIEKEGKPLVLDGRGKLIRGEARMSGSELFERHYDKVSREFTRKTQLEPTQNKAVEKAAGITKERTSHVPMKVK